MLTNNTLARARWNVLYMYVCINYVCINLA